MYTAEKNTHQCLFLPLFVFAWLKYSLFPRLTHLCQKTEMQLNAHHKKNTENVRNQSVKPVLSRAPAAIGRGHYIANPSSASTRGHCMHWVCWCRMCERTVEVLSKKMAHHFFWILLLGCLAVCHAAPTIAPTVSPTDQNLAEVKR